MVTTAIIVLLILLNGLFVAAEFAIVGVPRVSIERRAAQGSRAAQRVLRILRSPREQDRYIATAQLGITLASLGLGMYGEHALAQWLGTQLNALGLSDWIAVHALASVLAIALLTYVHIVLGEMVPKSLALQRAEQTALRITAFMLAVKTAMLPLVLSLNGIGNGLLRLFGVDRSTSSAEHIHTPEELQYIIEESQQGGLLKPEAAEVIRELFEFSELTAGEVMIPRVRVRGLPRGLSQAELAETLRSTPHTRYPVYEGDLDHVVGMVHVKDLLRSLVRTDALQTPPPHPVAYVPATATLEAVRRALTSAGTEMAIVMDEHGGTAGLLTVEDLFEEIVGELEEGTQLQPELFEDAEGRLHADGTVRLSDVGERLGQMLEYEEVDTVSGLVLALLNRPPAVGDVVAYDHVRFEVVAVEGHGVGEAIVSLGTPEENVPVQE